MARPFYPKINRHVTYYGVNRKPRPGTVTALNGAGSTTLAAAASANDTTISTVATASVGQWVTIVDGINTEQRRVSVVTGVGPFTLTVPAIRYGHASGTVVRLEATSVNMRIGRAQTINTVPRQVNDNDTNVYTPA